MRPPGTERPRRWRPRLRYELIGCGLHGHELLGTAAAHIRPEDDLVVRTDIGGETGDGLRWYRCVRCDSWLPLPPPGDPTEDHLPDREHIELPLRGKPLRDRYVLRLIAIDRILHFVVLTVLAIGILVFLKDRTHLHDIYYRVIDDIQNGVGGPSGGRHTGLVADVDRLFDLRESTLKLVALVVFAYAALEGVEAVGLWFAKRWAEYLTFVATTVLLIPEVYELTETVSPLKVLTLLINIAVIAYLLWSKRLFGVRGGGRIEQEERERDTGWAALERSRPGAGYSPPHARTS